MEAVPARPNVELRPDPVAGHLVVLAFPYDAHIVEAVRRIPGRKFDWDSREWSAPADAWAGVHVRHVLARWPHLTTSPDVDAWLSGIGHAWIGWVTTTVHDGRGWFSLRTRAGELPDELRAIAQDAAEPDTVRVALTLEAGEAIVETLASPKLDSAANRCITLLRLGLEPPPAVLHAIAGVDGPAFKIDVLWDHDAGAAFLKLPGAQDRSRTLPVDPFVVEHLDAFVARFGVEVGATAEPVLEALRAEHDAAREAVARSRARHGTPPEPEPRLGGTLEPFQWAGVDYVLRARRAFLADEQGLGKTVQALAALEADDAWPAVVVCPASLKLVWEREAERWLPHRTRTVVSGRAPVFETADLTILNYELVGAHAGTLARRGPRALVLDESHYCKNPRAKRTQAVRRLASQLPEGALRLALSGTPVLNRADELIPQLRILGRMEEFGTAARFAERFKGDSSEERLHWHLRRSCFVRRRKSEVLPQLPAKRQVVLPVALSNEREYRMAEEDVVAWLRAQPLDLSTLEAKIARTLRAERLAQLGLLKRLAAAGKLAAALTWIHDFLESGEPLVVFAHHVEVQRAVLERFPDAAHLLGADAGAARDATVEAFQDPDGPQLLVAATRVAGQGYTLTRASNVCFLELEWTPALHDQAEDRLHRIGQRDAVTAWYLLAAGTIDETIAELLARKREVVGAVTDGDAGASGSLVDAVAAALRDGQPLRHLRRVS